MKLYYAIIDLRRREIEKGEVTAEYGSIHQEKISSDVALSVNGYHEAQVTSNGQTKNLTRHPGRKVVKIWYGYVTRYRIEPERQYVIVSECATMRSLLAQMYCAGLKS